MNKFLLKTLSFLLFFWNRKKRKLFLAHHDAAIVHCKKLRKRGVSIGYGTFISAGAKVRDKHTEIGKYCSIASIVHFCRIIFS